MNDSKRKSVAVPASADVSKRLVWFLALIAFIAPLKFGTPVVIQSVMIPPQNVMEWLIFSWPNQLLVIVVVAGLAWMVWKGQGGPMRLDALALLPIIFLGTQFLALPRSINSQVSEDTVLHFLTCIIVFYAAARMLRDTASVGKIFAALALVTLATCVIALQQYFGGLEQTREFAMQHFDAATTPPDYLAKLTSKRVFGTFVYPNTLAGFLVLAFMPVLVWLRHRCYGWVRHVVIAAAASVMIVCLVLTGSRGGFVALAAAVVAGLACVARRTAMLIGVAVVVLAGLFWMAHRAGLMHTGSSSIESRLDYWRGAVAIARDHPWRGTGPGTFGSIYPSYKTAMSEEAQLVHNNFLEMWSDSGVLAFVAYAALWLVALWDAFRLARQRGGDPVSVALCAALTGWVVHGLIDFDLYIPGVALPAFLLLGCVQGLKEVPMSAPAKPNWRMPLMVGGVIVTLAVVWYESRMLAANFAYGRLSTPPPRLEDAESAARLAPSNASYQSVAGEAAWAVGERSAALYHFRAAVRADPFRAFHHRKLAEALTRLGGHESEAQAEFARAQALNPTHDKSVRQGSGVLLQSAPAKE